MKNKKEEKRQKNGRKKSRKKKGKEGPKGYLLPRWAQKLIFHIRTVKREIVTKLRPKKNQILSTKQRQRK